jgi:hypothetical protein
MDISLVYWTFHSSIGSNGHAKVQWTIKDPFDKWNVQWPFDFSIGHLAWVLDINQAKGTLPSEKGHFLCLLKTWGGGGSSYNGIVDGKSFETKTD